MSELRVPVRHVVVRFLEAVIGQCLNNNTQICQTLVDVVGLFQSHTSGTRLGLPFRSSQIDDIELGLHDFSFTHLLIINCEDSVTS
jgi:hypothetical protein